MDPTAIFAAAAGMVIGALGNAALLGGKIERCLTRIEDHGERIQRIEQQIDRPVHTHSRATDVRHA